jgi:hypothetical protein
MAVVPIHWETHDVGLVGDLELPWDRRVAELANIRANGKQVFITERDGSPYRWRTVFLGCLWPWRFG